MTEKPTNAFILGLIGGILVLVGGIGNAVCGTICRSLMASISPSYGAAFALFMYMGLISGIAIIVGSVIMHNEDPASIRKGSIITLIFSVIALIFGVFPVLNPLSVIGAILAGVGGYLGYSAQ